MRGFIDHISASAEVAMFEGRGWVVVAVALASLTAGCAAGVTDPAPGEGAATVAGVACMAPCGVSIEQGWLWEPMVATNPLDPLHLVASSQVKSEDPLTGRKSWALSHVSFDGGLTWETHRLPGGPDAPPGHPLATTTWMDDSVPMFLADGTLLWTVLAFETASPPGTATQTGVHLVALRSHDGGRTFPDAVVVGDAQGGDVYVGDPVQGGTHSVTTAEHHDKQWLTLGDDGTILLVWSYTASGRPDICVDDIACEFLAFSTSTDGLTWSPFRTIIEQVNGGPQPLILSDGTWLVSYDSSPERQAFLARSSDRGASWTIEAVGTSTKFPMMTRSPLPEGERLYLVYPRTEGDRDDEQTVVARWSDDGAATWSPEVEIAAPSAPGRTIPTVTAAPAGGAYVTFWSPRDGGADYVAVHLLQGNVSAPLVLGTHEGPTSRTGDYMGIASLPDGSAFAVWTASLGDEMQLLGARLQRR